MYSPKGYRAALGPRRLILGVTSMTIEFGVLLLYGALASGAHRWVRDSRFVRWIDRTVGAILVAIGISLAFVRRA